MSSIAERIADLSEDKRFLLELLRQENRKEISSARKFRPEVVTTVTTQQSQAFCLISDADRQNLPADVEDAYPLTMLQAGMIYHMEETPEYPLYHNVDSYNLDVELDHVTMQDAINRVVARHAVLRTSFALKNYSEPLQLVHKNATLPVTIDDLRHLPASEQDNIVNAYVEKQKRLRFDLARPPLLRFHIHRRTDETFQFTLTEFHPILDGWSLNSTLAEIFTTYFTLLKKQPLPDVPPLSTSFRDYVASERKALESDEFNEYWTQALRDASVMELPRWPASYRNEGDRPVVGLRVPIPRQLLEELKQLAQSIAMPLKSLLLAAHIKVMSALGGQQDVVTGLATQGRPETAGGDALRGLFLNIVPYRLDLPGGTWVDLIREAFNAERALLPYRRYPMAAIQKNLGGHPLFETCFSLVRFHVYLDLLESDNKLEMVGTGMEFEENNFTLSSNFGMHPSGSHLILVLEYHTSELCNEQVRAIATYYKNALSAMVNAPHSLHQSFNVISPDEQEQIIVKWNNTKMDFAGTECLHELFEQQAARTPEAVAVIFGSDSLTYQQLNERANQLAHHLRSLGVGAESVVAILMERSFEMVISMLAVLKAGGAYLPLDPEYPSQRLSYMLEDARVRVLLRQEGLGTLLNVPETVTVVVVDAHAVADSESSPATENAISVFDGDNLAYLIYTSGSTGTPKGVMVSHRAICNRLRWMIHNFGFDASERILHKTSFSFDASIWELFVPLISGARLVMARPGGQQESDYLAEVIVAEQITTVQFVPSMLRVMVSTEGFNEANTLRRVFCGGEVLSPELVNSFFERQGLAELHNLYGPTEAAIDATHWRCLRLTESQSEAERAELSDGVPIGRPISNMQMYVLDERMRCVPVGVSGEIYIGGMGLSRGYRERAELTAERFVPHPYSQEAGERLYRTGDIGRYRPDGSLEYVGRQDQQVKVRGYRIELGEIEAALREHESVAEAVVLPLADEQGHKRLVAYYVARGESITGSDEARCQLPNGLEVAFINHNEAKLIYGEIFDDEVYLKHGIELHDHDVVFDVGANIGLFSLFVRQRCRHARVYAFEPVPPVFEKLRANMAWYGLEVQLFEHGVSNRTGAASISFYPNWSGMSGLYADRAVDEAMTRAFVRNQGQELVDHADELLEGRFESETFACQLKTLSEVIREQQIEQIDLLKIDVEKSELDVLEGIAPEDWKKIRQIVMEAHDLDGQLNRIIELLEDHGFDAKFEQDSSQQNTGLYNIYAIHPSRSKRAIDVGETATGSTLAPRVAPTALSEGALSDFLKEKLPEYMVPLKYVRVDQWPVTANGKIDRRALSQIEDESGSREQVFAAPRTPAEEVLARIWSEALGVEQIGIHDNFFELGGDSIILLTIAAKASKAGLKFLARNMFQHPTIAELATVASRINTDKPKPETKDEPATGLLPLTPIQHAFFESQLDHPHYFNQSVMLSVPKNLTPNILHTIMKQIMLHHDALRLRFQTLPDGRTQASISEVTEPLPLAIIDLSHLPPSSHVAAIETAAAGLQASLNLGAGPILRLALFLTGEATSGNRLLLIIHHLAVDGVSWRILLEDMQTSLAQLTAGQALRLPAKTTSFKQWAEGLQAQVAAGSFESEAAYWVDQATSPVTDFLPPLPVTPAPTQAEAITLTLSLTTAETSLLLHEAAAAYHTQINDLLLTALALAVRQVSGESRLRLELEGHGREEIVEAVELGRTLGWFTTLFPVLLDISGAGTELGAAVRSTKEQLRAIPQHGIGYGLLKYLANDTVSRELRAAPRPALAFNYLGQFDQVLHETGGFAGAPESAGASQSEQTPLNYALEINGSVSGGRLSLDWSFSPRVVAQTQVEQLMATYGEALRSLITHCAGRQGAYTPADFQLSGLGQAELDRLLARVGNEVEDIYPLSPLQEGLLFHTVQAPGSGVYMQQMSCRFGAGFDVEAFKDSWRDAVQRHGILRTGFAWEGLGEPVQVVRAGVELEVKEQDWTGMSEEQRAAAMANYLAADRERGFEVQQGPLMRMALMKEDDAFFSFVWTTHHLILDGWSMGLLVQEVFENYEARLRGTQVLREAVRPNRDYIEWLLQQDMSQAEAYWRKTLKGFTTPTPLGLKHSSNGKSDSTENFAHQVTTLSASRTEEIKTFARRQKLTLNTVIQGAWALLLSRDSGVRDVVFGVVVSGRPTELEGFENMIGVFINMLPMRTEVRVEQKIGVWLSELQKAHVEMGQFEHSPLVQVQGWSEVPRGLPLFESYLNFLNYPLDDSLRNLDGPLEIHDARSIERANYPIAIDVMPGKNLSVEITYDVRRFDAAEIAHTLRNFEILLDSFVAHPDITLRTLEEILNASDRQVQAAREQNRQESLRQRIKTVRRRVV